MVREEWLYSPACAGSWVWRWRRLLDCGWEALAPRWLWWDDVGRVCGVAGMRCGVVVAGAEARGEAGGRRGGERRRMTPEEQVEYWRQQALGTQQAAHLREQAPVSKPPATADLTPTKLVLATFVLLTLGLAWQSYNTGRALDGARRDLIAVLQGHATPTAPQVNLQPLVDAVNANRRLTDLLATNVVVLARRVNALTGPPAAAATNAASTNTPPTTSNP